MSNQSIEYAYLDALLYRKSLPDRNWFDIATLQKLPKFFGWINCETSTACRFSMYLAAADDGVALRFFWNSQYETHTMKMWSWLAQNSKNIILDVGAHTGVYTLAALSAGCKSVASFEPHFMNFSRLLMNLRGNDFSTQGAHMLGVGKAYKNEFLSIPTNLDYLSTGGRVGARDGCINFPIKLCALDRFFGPGEHKIDLLKIDVEGFEPDVLSGAIDLITHSKPIIFFECLSDEVGAAIGNLLSPLGYKFWMVDDLEGIATPVARLEAALDHKGRIRMTRLNRIASCSKLEFGG